MTAYAYFLNYKEFQNKDKTQTYHVLTVCSESGAVSEYFTEESYLSKCLALHLFQPLTLQLEASNYHGKARLNLVSFDIIEEE